VDLYQNAHETEHAATLLHNSEAYRQSIYFYCLAVELYLKSKLHLVPHDIELEKSHDTLGLYNALLVRFKPKADFRPMLTRCRKYFNESRYPYSADTSAYTKEFASEFKEFVAAVRDFIDNECIASVDDLVSKHLREEQ